MIEVLNRYLTTMTDVILDHGGTLVAFMGDGIMAVFGAPIARRPRRPRLAAAREMAGPALERVQRMAGEQGCARGFRIGIGLNSGPVMAGNVGSEKRLEYTAIGDTTNTASRIEGMTKGTPHTLFLADSTRELLISTRRSIASLVAQPQARRPQTHLLLAPPPAANSGRLRQPLHAASGSDAPCRAETPKAPQQDKVAKADPPDSCCCRF